MFAGCEDEGSAHSHNHNCFLQLFNQPGLVDIVFVFFFSPLIFPPPVVGEAAPCIASYLSEAVTRDENLSKSLFFSSSSSSLFVIRSRRRFSLPLSRSDDGPAFCDRGSGLPKRGNPVTHVVVWLDTVSMQPRSVPPPLPGVLTVVTCAPADPRCPKIKRPLSRARRINISLSIFQNSF